jgi:hypothetical protein
MIGISTFGNFVSHFQVTSEVLNDLFVSSRSPSWKEREIPLREQTASNFECCVSGLSTAAVPTCHSSKTVVVDQSYARCTSGTADCPHAAYWLSNGWPTDRSFVWLHEKMPDGLNDWMHKRWALHRINLFLSDWPIGRLTTCVND